MQEIEDHEFKWWEYLTPEDWNYGKDYVPKKEDYTKYGVLCPPRFHSLVEYLNNGCPLKYLLPLDDHVIQLHFPILKGTKYAVTSGEINPKWVPMLGKVIQTTPFYNMKIQELIDLPVTKDIFPEHTLFLMREHLKIFMPYSNEAKELFEILKEFGDAE